MTDLYVSTADEIGPASVPVRASIIRRALAWLVDYVIVMVPSLALVGLAVATLVQGLPGYLGAATAEFGWSRLVSLITHRGAGGGAFVAALSEEWLTFALPLLGALVVVPLVQFAYQVTLLAWRGRTFGKMLADTRVGASASEVPRLRAGLAVRRAVTTTALETGVLSAALLVAVVGQFLVGAIIWAAAVVAFWLNAFAAIGPRRRTLVDRLAGTVVVRTSLYADAAARTAGLARGASAAAVTAGRKSSDLAVTAGRRTSDAAVVVGQLAREGAQAVTRSAPVQSALSSRAAQQAQVVGSIGADAARQLSGQAATRARQVGGRARQMWQDQRAKQRGEPELPQLPEQAQEPHRPQ